jgi:thioredoxin 1
MSDSGTESDELDRLREQRRAELEARLREGDDGAASAFPDEGGHAGGTPAEPVHVEGGEHLSELVANYDVVLTDFYADWCGPCKTLEPIVAELAAETDAVVAKVDVDAHQALAGQYNVRGVPTLVLFAGGEPVEQIVGVRNKDQLAGLIERHG